MTNIGNVVVMENLLDALGNVNFVQSILKPV